MANSSPFNSKLVSELGGSSIRDMFKRASGKTQSEVADMSLGAPYGSPPKSFSRTLVKLVKSNPSHSYMDNSGYYRIREVIAESLKANQLMPENLSAENVIVCAGSSGGLNCVLKSILNPGDEVLVLAPYFPDFGAYVENHGGMSIFVKLPAPEFDPDVEILARFLSPRTKALIINTPNNPTGKVYSGDQIVKIHKWLAEAAKEVGHPIYLISDETYRDIVFPDSGKEFVSSVRDYPDSVMVYSFSKSANVPGERIGYVVINPGMDQRKTLSELVSLSQRKLGFTNAPALMQNMVPELLKIRPDVGDYQKKRDLISEALTKARYVFNLPEGAFYFFVKYPMAEGQFLKLAQEKGLFVVPGRAFGENDYFRIAFSRGIETVRLAARILKELGE